MMPAKKRNSGDIPLYLAALTLILIFAGAIRFYNLAHEPLWSDEAITIHIAGKPLHSMIRWNVLNDTTPPFYYMLLWFWIRLFGISEFAARSLSAIFGTISVLVIYYLGKEIFNKEVGIISSIILSVSPIHIYYSQEARAYSLVILMTILSFLFLYRAQKNRLYYPAYIIATALLIYTHYYTFLVILLQNIFFLYKIDKEGRHRQLFRWLRIQFYILLLILPWLPIFFFQIYFKIKYSHNFPIFPMTISAVLNTFIRFAGNKILVIVYIFLWIVLLVWIYRKKVIRDICRVNFLQTWFVFPILSLICISYVFQIFYHYRYVLFCIIPIYILAAYVISQIIGRPLIKLILIILIISLSLHTAIHNLNTYDKYQFRQASEYIKNNGNPGDIVIINDQCRHYYTFAYYHDKDCFLSNDVLACLHIRNIYSSSNDAVIPISDESVWVVQLAKDKCPPMTDYVKIFDDRRISKTTKHYQGLDLYYYK